MRGSKENVHRMVGRILRGLGVTKELGLTPEEIEAMKNGRHDYPFRKLPSFGILFGKKKKEP